MRVVEICRTIPRRLSGEARGNALVELAVVMPLLVVLLIGTIDFGRIFYTGLALTQAARAGAAYAVQSDTKASDTAGIVAAAQNAVQADIGAITVLAPSPLCQCLPNSPTSPDSLDGGSVACATFCPSGQHLAMYVSVTASQTFTSLSRYPGIPSSVPISRTTTIRVK